MPTLNLKNLGRMIANRRGTLGIRASAKEIGVSPATLSRVERGNLPDLETFRKICDWLEIDPGEVLGSKKIAEKTERPPISVHFKKDVTIDPQTAEDLAQLIMAAQRAMSVVEPKDK